MGLRWHLTTSLTLSQPQIWIDSCRYLLFPMWTAHNFPHECKPTAPQSLSCPCCCVKQATRATTPLSYSPAALLPCGSFCHFLLPKSPICLNYFLCLLLETFSSRFSLCFHYLGRVFWYEIIFWRWSWYMCTIKSCWLILRISFCVLIMLIKSRVKPAISILFVPGFPSVGCLEFSTAWWATRKRPLSPFSTLLFTARSFTKEICLRGLNSVIYQVFSYICTQSQAHDFLIRIWITGERLQADILWMKFLTLVGFVTQHICWCIKLGLGLLAYTVLQCNG